MSRSVVCLAVVAASLLAERAHAGACPTCNTNAECAQFGPGAVCVEWDRDFGCGALRRSCCPGQGCALDGDGMPSCLGRGCTYVEPPVPDGGVGRDTSAGDAPLVADAPLAGDAPPAGDVPAIDGGDHEADAGAGVDSGAVSPVDTGPRRDTGTGAIVGPPVGGGARNPRTESEDGCSCAASRPSRGAWGWGLAVFLGLALRRRR